jgi:hypothetical protein
LLELKCNLDNTKRQLFATFTVSTTSGNITMSTGVTLP